MSLTLLIAKEGPVVAHERAVSITDLPEVVGGLRIAHLCDMHFSRWKRVYRSAQRLLLALDYDVVCVTGDVGHYRPRWDYSLALAERFLGPVVARAPVYAALGNHDHPNIASRMTLPVHWLHNRGTLVNHAGGSFYLAGLDQNVPSAEDLGAALGADDAERPTVLLAHYPSTVFRLPLGRVDLMLSGHTHGGQIRFPGLGCVWPNDRIPRRMARGLHRVGPTAVHVCPGLGTSLPIRVRFLCPPEVTILRLVPAVTVGRTREVEKGAISV